MTVENLNINSNPDNLNLDFDLINFNNYKYINHKIRLVLISIAFYLLLFFVLYSFLQYKTHDQIIAFSPNILDHTSYTINEISYLVLKSCLWQPMNNITCPTSYELIMTNDICPTSRSSLICVADNITQHYDNTFYPNCQSLNSLNNIVQSNIQNYNHDYYLNDYIILNAEPNVYALCGIILLTTTIALIILSYILITRQYSRCNRQSQINNIENKIFNLLIITTIYFALVTCLGPLFIITDTTITSMVDLVDLNCSTIDFYQNQMNFVQQILVNYRTHLDHSNIPYTVLLAIVSYAIISICIIMYNIGTIMQIKK